jgi:hypothetical protein
MKKSLLFVLALAACSESVHVITNEARVSELERRANLNDMLDNMQSELIESNNNAVNARIDALDLSLTQLIADEQAAREAADANLQAGLDAEQAAREAGDSDLADQIAAETAARQLRDNQLTAALAASIAAQTVINFAVQGQIALINSKFPLINSKLSSLQSQVNNANSNISSLQSQVAALQVDVSDLDARMMAAEGDISSLEASVLALTTRLDQEGVRVFKCNAASSKERMFKINNKFYAVMNHVSTESIQVITGSSSVLFTNPKLCVKDEKAKLPGGSGNCPHGWDTVGGNSVSVPSYSTANKTVVTSAQMALEPLPDGSYSTTDGAAPCYFTVTGGGTASSNLVQVQ